MLFESWENVARRCASCGEAMEDQYRSPDRITSNSKWVKQRFDIPASRRSGGAYDMVCCAVVGDMLPGLAAVRRHRY